MRRRQLLILVPGLVLTLALAACGGGDSGDAADVEDAVAKVATEIEQPAVESVTSRLLTLTVLVLLLGWRLHKVLQTTGTYRSAAILVYRINSRSVLVRI